jgi:subtilase family serine protease
VGSAIRIAFALLLVSVRISHATERYELRNSVSPRATVSRWLRAADPDESLEMSVTLRLRQADQLASLISAQQDPVSPQYHRWLTPDEFAARFAPLPEEQGAVVDWLQREGFVVRPKVNGARIDFSGTVMTVERTFGVRMSHYSHRGRTPLANENPPLLPVEFIDSVDFVRLNTFPLADPLVRVSRSTGLVNAMAPLDMYVAYDMQTMLDAGVNGSGQTIAVVARSDFNVSDVASFEQQFGVPVHSPLKVFPSTHPGVGAPNGVCQGIRDPRQLEQCMQGEEGEVLLDTEWASAMAPGATVLVDISGADIDASLLDIVTNHSEAKTITMSFGACERLDSSDISVFGAMYAQAAAQGQAVLVTTGDDGADGCQDGRGRSVNVLASDPNVTAVGGTALDPGFNASGNATAYVSETVWNDVGGASGGGVSALVSKPAYQSAPGVPADGFRDQPDVSLLASPTNAGYVMVIEGAVAVIGGTSVAAPSWAGIVALLDHALHIEGLGPLNATLYALGRQQYAGNGAAVFHDITQGNTNFNGVRGYGAGPGYDLASGLGTPDVAVLAQALGASDATRTPTTRPTSTPTKTPTAVPSTTMTQTPPRATPTQPPTPTRAGPCIGDCNNSGDVTVNELLIMVNIALGTADISLCGDGVANQGSAITVDEILTAVNNVLNGCAP